MTIDGAALYVEEDNLSHAWTKVFMQLMQPGVSVIAPLVVTVAGFSHCQPTESKKVCRAVNIELKRLKGYDIGTVANTIFPSSLWNVSRNRQDLYDRYNRILPRLKKYPRNKYGLYFERLIAFGDAKTNQLEHIINTYCRKNHRKSALQATLFMPTRDLTHQRQRGFPCLQHVAFTPIGKGELEVTGFYASQYIFDRAYGNYLGLCHLGKFVAHETGLDLVRMTCVAAAATLGSVSKQQLKTLSATLCEGTTTD